MPNLAVKIDNLSKVYHLYDDPIDRLKESLHPFRKKYHRDFYALRDVNIEIKKGEIIGVIGKNGSGKSTLLKLITGVLTPTEGDIIVGGKISALLELGAGFNNELSGLENIYFNGTLMGYTKEETESKLDEILAFADIGEFIHQPVKTYSSGMFVRLAFSVATNVNPDILIVDEALSVGDMRFQAKCKKRMQLLMENGCTTLIASHDMGTMKSLCSNVVYLEEGIVKSSGSSGEVCDQFIYDQMGQDGLFKKEKVHKDVVTKNNLKYCEFNIDEKDLKLFEEQVDIFRKGDGSLKIINSFLLDENGNRVNEVFFNQALEVVIILTAFHSVENIVIAMYIRDKNMIEIIGSNNIYEDVDIGPLESGSTYRVNIKFRNILRGGPYSTTIILADSLETSTYHDWIDNAIMFKSHDLPNRKRWAFANPKMEFSYQAITLTND